MRSRLLQFLCFFGASLLASAFVRAPAGRLAPQRLYSSSQTDGSLAAAPQAFHNLEAAAEEAREAAEAFGNETAHFMNVWLGKVVRGGERQSSVFGSASDDRSCETPDRRRQSGNGLAYH
eukprot:scaffold803_cov310-Pinguiococcus_pyrenoidosus.AAC.32